MEDKEAILRMVADYENPGEGGFYDDAGEEGLQPHLIRGDTFDAAQMLDPANRPSQNTVAYSIEEPRGVAFRYTALDPKAQYRVRVTLAMPRIPKDVIDLPRDAVKAENLLADDAYLAEGIEVPSFTAKQFEYDVPKKLTQDGTLDLTFERVENGIGCIVSEVWLMKRP
ncbi:MAG: hypothetical protein QG656_2147 [Candidatus Hydrogenedentes bacterium]|nr:hypothetical protein [Candidatus Hydrogenedentota bacterium]